MSEDASGAAEIAAAWRAARDGLPSVVRFTGDPSAALDALAEPVVPTWPVDALPEGPSRILWFAGDVAGQAAADRVVAAVVLLRLPWLVVVSGPRAMEVGVPYGLVVPRGASGTCRPTRVTGLAVPEDPDALERAVIDAAEDGRPGDAASLLHALEARDPERARLHRWIHVARAFFLGRNDAIE